MLGACLAVMMAVGCVPVNPPPPPPPPPPPAVPAGLLVQPSSLAQDAQGNLWFTLLGIPKVGRLDRKGNLTEYQLPPITFAANIITGPDGNLWMVGIAAMGGEIGGSMIKTTPAGKSEFFELPDAWVPEGLAFGPDGNLWFTAWEHANPDAPVALGRAR
jgi:streptogramin lyase